MIEKFGYYIDIKDDYLSVYSDEEKKDRVLIYWKDGRYVKSSFLNIDLDYLRDVAIEEAGWKNRITR